MKKNKGYWDIKTNCDKEAAKYTSKKEFAKQNKSAYNAAIRNKWIDTYEWDEKRLQYTYDLCFAEAKKYEYQRDFRNNSTGFYDAARRNRWIKDYPWLKKGTQNIGPFLIYAYEDTNNKVVYIGLTNNVNNRHSRHKCGTIRKGVRKYDALAKYWQSINKPLPNPIIKIDGLDTEEDAQYYEDWYKKAYANENWKVLNIAPTGIGSSSVGGNRRKWTEEKIREAAKDCISKTDFYEKHSGAAQAAYDLKIISELFPKRIRRNKVG